MKIDTSFGYGKDYVGIEIQASFGMETQAEKLKIEIPKWARLWNQVETLVKYAENKDITMDGYTQVFRKFLDESKEWGKNYETNEVNHET